jgi:Putative Ig domain
MVLRISIIIVTLILSSIQGWTSVLFVDNTLSANCLSRNYSVQNRNDKGSDGNCYITLQGAINTMKPGDTVLVRNGTYNEMSIYMGDLRNGTKDAWYTITSFPGEWAVIDGKHNMTKSTSQVYPGYIFCGTSAGGVQGYIRFERLEVTGGGLDTNATGYPSSGGGIVLRGGPFEFRYLYIHNNYGDMNSNNAGIRLEGGSALSTIEYCHFKANGDVKTTAKTTSMCNLIVLSDYKYEGKVVFNDPLTGFPTATYKNEVRYNLFEADAGNGYYSYTGFKHKGMQRLTGYTYCDQRNPKDSFPNDSSYQSYGDKIHNNVFINLPVAIEVDQDYAQVYNNVIVAKVWNGNAGNCVQGRDENADRRGPHRLCIYNNTIVANGVRGIMHHPVPQDWSGIVPIAECWIQNNIIDNPGSGWHAGKISVSSDGVTASGGYPLNTIHLDHNYFYNTTPDSLVFINLTYYTNYQFSLPPTSDTVFFSGINPNDPLYGASASSNPNLSSSFKTIGSHIVQGALTIANCGKGGKHPYLAGVVIPSYIGATDPNDPGSNAWVDNILNLQNLGKKKLPPSISNVLLSNPGHDTVYASSLQIIRWSISADNPITRCTLYVSMDSAKTWKTIDTLSSLIDSFPWTVADTVASECYFKIAAVDDSGQTGTGVSSAFAIIKRLQIRKKELVRGSVDRFYADTLYVESGIPPFLWTIVAGSLPDALNLDSLTGAIRGVPHTKGTFPFTVTLTDAEGHTAQDTFSIVVDSVVVGQNLVLPNSIADTEPPGNPISDTIGVLNNSLKLSYTLFAAEANGPAVGIPDSIVTLSNGTPVIIATIPGRFVSDTMGERAFIVVSNGTINDTLSLSHPVYRPANNCDNISVGNLEWTPLSVTATPVSNGIASVLKCYTPAGGVWAFDQRRFRVIQWYPYADNSTDTNKWVEATQRNAPIFNFVPGKLFWIKSRETQTINFGPAIVPSMAVAQADTLNAGQWTDFSVPLNFSVFIQDIVTATKQSLPPSSNFTDSLDFYQWTKSGATWTAGLMQGHGVSINNVMRGGAGTAYTVYNPNSSFVLRIPPLRAESTVVAPSNKKSAKATQNAWLVSFNFQDSKGDGLNPVYFGYSLANAGTTFLQKPPSFGNVHVSVYDPQSKRYFGHAIVHDSSGDGAMIRLAFQNETDTTKTINSFVGAHPVLPANMHARFFDPSRSAWTSQPDAVSVALPPNSTIIVFAGVGKETFFSGLVPLLSTYRTRLTTIYPNPCVNRLTVKYTLSYPSLDVKEMDFVIYNVLGRVVWSKKISNGFGPGENSLVFDRTAGLGGKLANGIYILRMSAVNASAAGAISFTRRISFVD